MGVFEFFLYFFAQNHIQKYTLNTTTSILNWLQKSSTPIFSYMILAPAIMTAETDQKKAAFKCFESVGLDPDSYRIGHTKARYYFWFVFLCPPFCLSLSLYLLYNIPMTIRPSFDQQFSSSSLT